MLRNPYADLAVIVLVVLLFFGPKRLPGLGRSLGSGIKEFKDSLTGGHHHEDEDEDRPALTQATAAPGAEPSRAASAAPAEPAAPGSRAEQN